MIQNQNCFLSSQSLNNPKTSPINLNSEQKPNYINKIILKSTKPIFTSKKPYIIKKRNYNELMESYKEKFNNLYKKENEELFKAVNLNFQKNISKSNPIYEKNNNKTEKILLIKDKKDILEKNKFIKLQKKKFMINDDIDDVEKDFIFEKEKEKKVEKKYKLSKSYLYEELDFCSDLEDTKENSFSALNFSVDYPDINLDASIKDKLITNAIELEKTFHRFFNVKNMPNKK